MTIANIPAELSLRSVMRQAPTLEPRDSVERFVQLTRHMPGFDAPVQSDGKFVGVVGYDSVLPLLSDGPYGVNLALVTVGDLTTYPPAVASPRDTVQAVAEACAQFRMTSIVVVGDSGEYLGLVWVGDLITRSTAPAYPAPVGGMATPFGVYLTNGRVRGGASDGALFAAGAMLGLLSIASVAMATLGWYLAAKAHIVGMPPGLSLEALSEGADFDPGAGGFVWTALVILIFLCIMRTTRMAAYHAAEHQTVHAMERQERLTTDIVARMPRPHPRCGTNIWVAGMVYTTLMQAIILTRVVDVVTAGVLAAVATLFVWRRVGAVAQQMFTTRPAGERELRSGIGAAEQLIQKYLAAPPGRPGILRRIWCMGLVQSASGMIATLCAFQLAIIAFTRFAH